jgi:GT2 family glycosyltransferase
MTFSISVLGFNKSDCTKKCLDSIEKNSGDVDYEVIFVNNGSVDDTETIVLHSNIENKIYIPLGENIGFPAGHNLALNYASGEYFICLNNDVIINEKNWLEKLIKPMIDNPNIVLSGFGGAPCSLRKDGSGFIGDKLEYIEGSCIAGKAEFFRDFGLFNPCYDMFFYEDSDLSLRVRQCGYKIATVNISNKHIRSSSLNQLSDSFKRTYMEKNKKAFLDRWKTYLNTRRFDNVILLKMFSHGGGDLVCMTPVLESIRKDHPHSRIELETNWADIFKENPHIDEVYGNRKNYNHGYDRIIDFTLDYSSCDLIVDSAAKIASTKLQDKTPSIYLDQFEFQHGSDIIKSLKEDEEDIVIGCALQMDRYKWQGRNWNFENSKILISALRDSGFKVIEFGKNIKSTGVADLDLVGKTTLRELFSIVANLDIFIGVDSMIFHIAQAFQIPSYVLFGATEPISRVVNFDNTFVIRNNNLNCLGCYQKKAKSDYNKCIMNRESCLQELSPDVVYQHVIGEIDGIASNIKYLQNRIRGG